MLARNSMGALPEPFLTEEEYLAIERAASYRSEYIDGEMYAMAGAGETHGTIVTNIVYQLTRQFQGRPCKACSSDLRVRVSDTGLYTYPDVVALCGSSQLLDDRGDTLLNPQLIVEVLSPGTAFYDRTEKFRRYRQISSFTDYVLVWQHKMRVEHWQPDPTRPGADWQSNDYYLPDERLHFSGLAANLTLAEIYKVSFTDLLLRPVP